MEWIKSQEMALPHFKSSVLTIGNFDGVHLGHQKLLGELLSQSKNYKVPSIVCTFKPHPRQVLRPQEPHHRLFDYRDQFEVMSKMNLDYLIEEKFSKDFSLMSADEFLSNYIDKIFKPVHLVVGYDFNFGKSREGNADFLKTFCEEKKWHLTIVKAYEKDGQIVSTTQIRNLLEHGDLKKAEEYLGRPYYLRGPVRLGYKRGRTLGVPTANLSPEIDFVPRKGVYFTWAYLNDQKFASITNIGFNPTFEHTDSYLKVETHLFNFDQDIYGEHLKVELCQFHRDEIKFGSFDQLKTQIHKDLHTAKVYFGLI
jgi:riboflavin kinase/FMN adenylyltransferase